MTFPSILQQLGIQSLKSTSLTRKYSSGGLKAF